MCEHKTGVYVLDICGCRCCTECAVDVQTLACKQCQTIVTMQDLKYIMPKGVDFNYSESSVLFGIIAPVLKASPKPKKPSKAVKPPKAQKVPKPPDPPLTPLISTFFVVGPTRPEDCFLSDDTFSVSTTGNLMRYIIAQRMFDDTHQIIQNAQKTKLNKTRCSRCTMMCHNKASPICPAAVFVRRSPILVSQAELHVKQNYAVAKTVKPVQKPVTPEKIKGTGFGGSGTDTKTEIVSTVQRQSDTENTVIIRQLYTCISEVIGIRNAVDFMALRLYLPVILELLRNDSIFDIHLRKDLYTELLRFLRVIAQTAGLSELLVTDINGRCICTEYVLLNKQADTFMKLHSVASSSDAEIDSDVLEMLGIAFDISDTYTAIKEIQDLYPVASSSVSAPESAKSESDYIKRARELSFMEADLDLNGHSHYLTFREDPGMSKAKLMAVSKELASMSTSLPLSVDSAVVLRVSNSRMDVMSFLVTGPVDTPYAYGCFIFDLYLPRGYPTGPPVCKLRTTGGGVARFNPNLYACGKVCLSLLGTWSGPGWVPNVSSILQVIISIQSLIMVSEPYFNEPGYESQRHGATGMRNSKEYNRKIQGYTMRYAILDHLTALTKGVIPADTLPFADFMRMYYIQNKTQVLQQLSSWGNTSVYSKIKKRLDRLK